MKIQENIRILQFSNIVTTVIVFFINMLASSGVINNTTPGQLSDNLPNLFVPAGITFSIWGIIYLLLFLFIVYQARSVVKNDVDKSNYLHRIGWFFVLSNFVNIAWIFSWHYELVHLSLFFMILLLASLITIYFRLEIGNYSYTISSRDRFFFTVPFRVYLGWITVATVANVTTFLVWMGVEPYNSVAVFLTIIMILITTFITALILYRRKDIIFGLVIVWAFIGIVIKRVSPDYFVELNIATVAAISSLIIVIMILLTILTERKRT
ncbi:hypothetical protein [[Eubacterium] cellulosolvens]